MPNMLTFLGAIGDVDRRTFLRLIEQFPARVALRKLIEERIKINVQGGFAICMYRSAASKIAAGELTDWTSVEKHLRSQEATKAWEAQPMRV
jgi:hypothetical protein